MQEQWARAFLWNIKRIASVAGCTDISIAAPWLQKVIEMGPTPWDGPLHFDILPPTKHAPQRWGINIFGHHQPNLVYDLAQQWARTRCTTAVQGALKKWGNYATLTWNGGITWSKGEWYLKLYVTGGPNSFPAKYASLVNIQAIGFDVRTSGIYRYRSYHSPARSLFAGWPVLNNIPQREEISHQLFTISREKEANEKRSQNLILAPWAAEGSILALGQQLGYAALAEEYSFWKETLRLDGFSVGIVALEWDMYKQAAATWDYLFGFRRTNRL